MNLNSDHLAKGQECPALIPGSLRIYNMRFCPYAQRALLAASAKGVKYDVVNINLMEKPEFILTRNPEGKVPTIETPNGGILFESLIVADYIDEAYNSGDTASRRLTSEDPFQRALDRMWMENFNKVAMVFFKLLIPKDVSSEEVRSLMKQLNKELGPFEAELKRRGTKYFGGKDKAGMLDYMIWPWFERFPCLEFIYKDDWFIVEECRGNVPLLVEWRKAMMQDKAVKEIHLSPENHAKYMMMRYRTPGATIDYDFWKK